MDPLIFLICRVLYQEKLAAAANQRRFRQAVTPRPGRPERILTGLGDVLILASQWIKAGFLSDTRRTHELKKSNK